MVEFNPVPASCTMAFLTLRTETLLVNILLEVTGNTFARRVSMFSVGLVTGLAGRFEMPAKQFEICRRMIKFILVQTENICVTTFMIGMTCGALVDLGGVRFAMKTCPAADISGDVLVTIEAERSLFRPVEALVAGGALELDFGMSEKNFAGHHQGLEGLSVSCEIHVAGKHCKEYAKSWCPFGHFRKPLAPN